MSTTSDSSKENVPVRDREIDGVYVRCVWCNGENYGPNVLDYSRGISACHQCGKLLPKDYVKLKPKED